MNAPLPDEQQIDTTNKYIVASRGSKIMVMSPPSEMTAEEAMVFAAWIVALASMKSRLPFQSYYDEVCAL
jgi:hypothetical protein